MLRAEESLEERVKVSLSKENIDRQVLASLLRGDTPEQLAGALFIVSTLFNEAIDLLTKSMERVNSEAELAKRYEFLFEATEHHRKHGLKFQSKRLKNSKASNTKYIEELVANNKNLSAKELYKIADKDKVGEIAFRTFANKVAKAKKSNFHDLATP